MSSGLSAPLTIHGLDNVTANGDSDYHVSKCTYNFMGYPVKMTDSLGQEETYTVDYLGNILSKTDRNGDTVTTTYNYRGQPLTVTSSKDNKSVTYTYDRLGNRKSMTDETGTTNYTYSNLSQLLSETKGGITKTYTYDKNGAKTGFTLTDNGTSRLANTYTVTNTGVLTAAQSGTDTVAYTYDNNRNMLTETVNGTLSQTNTYNKANQAVSVQNKKGTAQQSAFNYTYFENGNISIVLENLGTVEGRQFYYDGMGRLTEEILGTDSLNYTYDDFSNRTSLSRESGTTNYVYDGNNRLTTRTAGNTESLFNYDNNGNLYSTLTSTTGTAGAENESLSETPSDTDGLYTFDGLGRLTGLTKDGKTITYTYNGDGQRVSKTVDGVTTQYVWDGNYIVMEKTGNSTTVYKRANRLFANEKDGTKTFYRYNARGDVVQLTNASYAVTKTYQYDAFGNEQNPDANDTNPFRYCGEYYDTETGYIYLRARYYDPIIGRFISEDPIRDGLNWYVYCGNNPVVLVDPLGLESVVFFAEGMGEQAKVRMEYYTEKYGTESYRIETTSSFDFISDWNTWFSLLADKGIPVDAIEIISHGGATLIYGKDDSGTGYGTGFLYFGNDANRDRLFAREISDMGKEDRTIESLRAVQAKELHINACNSANPDVYNITFAFMGKVFAHETTGWDGGTAWSWEKRDHIRGNGEYAPWYITDTLHFLKKYQQTWYFHVEKDVSGFPQRRRIGQRGFWR